MGEHVKSQHSKRYEAGIEILTTIFKDERMLTNNSNVYTATKLHEIDNYIGISTYNGMFQLFENINVLIKESAGYKFNDKLIFRKVDNISIPEAEEHLKIKIALIVNVALSYIKSDEGVNCSEAKQVKHIIEKMDFISTDKIIKTLGGVACHYDIHTTQGNILSKLLLFSTLETPCTIKANINNSKLEFNDVIVKEIIIDENDIKITTDAIPLPILEFSNIKYIGNYPNDKELIDDVKAIISICSEVEELSELTEKLKAL